MSEPVPADPALHRLAEALDPAGMRAFIRRCLRRPGWEIEGCIVDRVRYRRGVRAVVGYRVRVVNGSTNESRDHWVTALLNRPDRTRHVWKRLQHVIPGAAEADDLPLAPAAMASDESLVLQTFPIDRRLPSLLALLHPERLISAALPSGEDTMGPWVVEPVRYRPGLGCAMRWRTSLGTSRGTTRYVKAYRDDQGAATEKVLASLAPRRGDGFAVPAPVAYLSEHRALVQEAIAGQTLTDLIVGGGDPGPLMERAARALIEFQRAPALTASRRTRRDHLADLGRSVTLVSWVRPSLAAVARDVMACVADRLPEAEPFAAHGDLKPDHVIVGDERMALVDLDAYARSDPVADAGAMLGRLAGLAVRRPWVAERIHAAERSFTETYFDAAPPGWEARLPAHLSAAQLSEAAACFRHQVAEWPVHMDTLTRRAAEALGG
ncbi:MAG TPA: phosphotransferase [Actinomycetota bacterium]|nr:phosphotransferase [Actinomycetota bacterium]